MRKIRRFAACMVTATLTQTGVASTNDHYQYPTGVNHGYWRVHPGYRNHKPWYESNKYCHIHCYFDDAGNRKNCFKHCITLPDPPDPTDSDVSEGEGD